MLQAILGGKKRAAAKAKKEIAHCPIVTDLLDPKGTDGDAIQSWRVFRIMSEFVSGFELLRNHGLAATFWGSARLLPTDPYYKAAEELAAEDGSGLEGFRCLRQGHAGPILPQGSGVLLPVKRRVQHGNDVAAARGCYERALVELGEDDNNVRGGDLEGQGSQAATT